MYGRVRLEGMEQQYEWRMGVPFISHWQHTKRKAHHQPFAADDLDGLKLFHSSSFTPLSFVLLLRSLTWLYEERAVSNKRT